MKTHFSLFLILACQTVFSQSWIAGDTVGLEVNTVATSFEADSGVSFDIDCDGAEDFRIYSSGPAGMSWPWMRLSFHMEDSVEVFNSNTGFVTTFEIGDTLWLDVDSDWTAHLDFIYGTGQVGPYGQAEISKKYIAFRKKAATDTLYCYLLFSSQGINFTVHQVISHCGTNPLEMLLGTEGVQENAPLKVLPNPTTGEIQVTEGVKGLEIYSLGGKLVYAEKSPGGHSDLSRLENGIYLVKIIGDGYFVVQKLIKTD
ncbi:MAG TPA: T9SS type A sorting domain-containing protein [Flavilitoribacter sp.]|nr:T9SS type A sorting domain-containing protein [Flavilitoribacter sp.]HMQ91169.1 T9SS type A sorting domain-containing protein [Flavilitoribacter sp.]